MTLFDLFDDFFDRELTFRTIFDDMFKELDELREGKGKSYNLSYKYETGMETPEVTVEGDVDQETIDNFIERSQRTFKGAETKLKEPDIRLLGSGKEEKEEE